jgi:hypothetical protein
MDILEFLLLFFKYTPFQQIGWWNGVSLTLILIELMKVKFIWQLFEMFVVIIYYVYAFVRKFGHA